MSENSPEPEYNARKPYSLCNEDEQKQVLLDLYEKDCLSMGAIAKLWGTNESRVRSLILKFEIPIRDRGTARKKAFESGRLQVYKNSQSPEAREKISKAAAERWNANPDTKAEYSERMTEYWKQNQDKVSRRTKAGMEAIRKTSTEGSKMEAFLAEQLKALGHKVMTHSRHRIMDKSLHLDLLLPSINVAIEVDGICHAKAIFGQKKLVQSTLADGRKNGLLMGSGLHVIRIRYTKKFTDYSAKEVLAKLLETLTKLKSSTSPQYVILEEKQWQVSE